MKESDTVNLSNVMIDRMQKKVINMGIVLVLALS